MTKADLKSGMIVEFRNGKQDMVMLNPDCKGREFIGLNESGGGYMPLCEYDEDLTKINGNTAWDIVKVYSVGEKISSIFSNEEYALRYKKLIWERKEKPVEMTIAEIEEKLGIKNLKIIKENNNAE